MKTTIWVFAIFLLLPTINHAQEIEISWGSEDLITDRTYLYNYFRGPEGALFALYRNASTAGLELIKFDETLSIEVRKELRLGEERDTSPHTIVDACTWGGEITLLTYQLTDGKSSLELSYSLIDPVTLEFTEELTSIATFPQIPPQNPLLSRYIPPLNYKRSLNSEYFIGQVHHDDGQKSELFVVGGADKEILWQSEFPESLSREMDSGYSGFYISESGLILLDMKQELIEDSTSHIYSHTIEIINPFTGEKRSHTIGNTEVRFSNSISESTDGTLVAASITEHSSSEATLMLFIPDLHESPIFTKLSEEEYSLIQSDKRVRKSFQDRGLALIQVEEKNDGGVVAIFNRRVSDSKAELVAVSISQQNGHIEWIRKIQRKKTGYGFGTDFPGVFYQDEALHVFYYSGKAYKNQGSVMQLIISDTGEISETVVEEFSQGEYWRRLPGSGNLFSNKLLIEKHTRPKRQLGAVSFK